MMSIMEIVNEYPPNFAAIIKRFPAVEKMPFVVVTYGDKIYNPSGKDLPPYLVTHESVHVQQQEKIGVEEWWRKYLEMDWFRLEQEVEAYHAEYKHFCKLSKDRNEQNGFLNYIATNLSSPLYGNLIRKSDAMVRIATGL